MSAVFPYLIKLSPLVVLLVLSLLALRRRNAQGRLAGYLQVYLWTFTLIQGIFSLNALGGLKWDEATLHSLNLSAAFLSALFLFYMSLTAVSPSAPRWLLYLGLFFGAGLAWWNQDLGWLAGWGALTLAAFALITRAFVVLAQPLQRNLVSYFFPVLALAILNDVLVFYGAAGAENFLRLPAAALLTFLSLRAHLPDTRDLIRQTLTYLVTSLLTVVVYLAGRAVVEAVWGDAQGYNPALVGASLALLVALVFSRLLQAVRALFNRLFRVGIYEPAQILRDYSTSISNILDLEKLATVAVGVIMEALEVQKGFLFLVDPELDENGRKVYRLSGIRGAGGQAKAAGLLDGESPIAHFLISEHQVLLQYDVDFAPNFLDAPVSERKWLGALGMDVYVPIYSKGEWIGLLALGPTGSGQRYTEEDLDLLLAIASQTGVALENARLVENLKKLNVQVREAYTYLDKANHDLATLELTKSNFISIASHELRTPLTVARAYAEMLLENDTLSDAVRDLVKGIHKATLRLHEIMDSMFDIAQLDTRTKELDREEVFVPDLLRSVAQQLSPAAAERQLELLLDLPQMPSIKADSESLKKLFHHLIINAIKFTPNQGRVTVTGRQLSPNNRDLPEGGVEIIVSDTGVGIEQKMQEVIFTKFYQPGELNRHSTGKTKFKGSGVGLGLALSRGIVEAHGGKIWVESAGYDEEKYPGSDFHVVLPSRSQGESKTVRMGSAVKLRLQ